MLRRTVSLFLVLALVLASAAALALSPGDTMFTNPPNGYNLNLRAAPSYEAAIVASYRAGLEVTVIADLGEFVKVSVSFVVGYMASEYLRAGNASAASDVPKPKVSIGTAYVSNPKSGQRLNLREEPSTSANVLGSYANGTPVVVYENLGAWLRVSIYGTSGYVMARYVGGTQTQSQTSQSSQSSSAGQTSGDTKIVVNYNGGSYVNIRSGAGYGFRVVGRASKGTKVAAQGVSGDWVKVSVNGVTGWINSAFLR